MWEFIIILLFSKTVLLTPNFIDIEKGVDSYALELSESISAITSGATIQVDVSEMVLRGNQMNLLETRRAVSDMFPEEAIDATLIAGNKRIRLTYQGGMLVNKDKIRLVLSGNEVPTGLDFSAVAIKADIKLERVKIYWKNYKK